MNIPVDPDGVWMLQMARGFLRNATHLIHDRDPLFKKAWTTLLKSEGVTSVLSRQAAQTAIPTQSGS